MSQRRATNASNDSYVPFKGTTTSSQAYVKHPLEVRKPVIASPQRGPDLNAPKFVGSTCYLRDYVQHPVEQRQKKEKLPTSYQASEIPMTSRSAYTESFVVHPTQPRTVEKVSKTPGAGYDVGGPPFNGQSSYKKDYVKHDVQRPNQRPKSSPPGPRRSSKIEAPPPFSGSTTYNNDYKKHPSSPQTGRSQSSGKQELVESPIFECKSEYQTQYLEKKRLSASRT